MYIEMPYKTKQIHKVARTWPISRFAPSENRSTAQHMEYGSDERLNLLAKLRHGNFK